MRLNLYIAAACSFLAYGIDALNISGAENAAATSHMDEYAYDLAQTYSDVQDKDKEHKEVTKCAKISPKKTDIKIDLPPIKKSSCSIPRRKTDYQLLVPKESCDSCSRCRPERGLRLKKQHGDCCHKKSQDCLINGIKAKYQSDLWNRRAS